MVIENDPWRSLKVMENFWEKCENHESSFSDVLYMNAGPVHHVRQILFVPL